MPPDELVSLLKRALAQRPARLVPDDGARRAAVLAPLFFRHGEPHLLFTQRTQDVPTHKGQVSFPGGAVEEYDGDLSVTALRETGEEVGIQPEQVQLLGRLDDLFTFSASFVITPFVGLVPDGSAHVTSDREVARLLEVPLAHLLDAAARQPDLATHHWRYAWEGVEIWGATARILNELLTILGLDDPFAEDLAILRALDDVRDKLAFTELMIDAHRQRLSASHMVRQSPANPPTPAIGQLVLGPAGQR